MSSIGRRSFLVLATGVLSSLMGFVSLVFMTRYLGAEDYGTLAWAAAFVAVFTIVSDLGVGYTHLKRVSEGCSYDDCVSTFAYLKILLTFAMATICLLYILLSKMLFDSKFSSTLLSIIGLLLLYQVLSSLSAIARTTFDSRLQTSKSQLISFVDPLTRTSLIILVLLVGMGLIQVVFAHVIGGFAVALVAFLMLSKERITWRRPSLVKSYLAFAMPLAVASIAGILLASSDRLVVGFFWSKADVAYYSSGQSLLMMFGTIGSTLAFISFPVFSRLQTEGRNDLINDYINQSERYISMIALPLVVLFVLFPRPIATVLFGDDFAPAGKVLGYLAISVLCYQLNQVACAQLLASNRVDVLAKLTWTHLFLNLVLLFVMVPRSLFGIPLAGMSYEGAAIANMSAMVTMFVMARWYIYQVAQIRIYLRLYLHVIAAIATGFLLALLGAFVQTRDWYALPFFATMSYVSFLAILFTLREFTKRDVLLFLEITSVRKMREYVSAELLGKGK